MNPGSGVVCLLRAAAWPLQISAAHGGWEVVPGSLARWGAVLPEAEC